MGYEGLRIHSNPEEKRVKEVLYNQLVLKVFETKGIDDPILYPSATNRFYRVIYWINPEKQLGTSIVRGTPDPCFNEIVEIPLDVSKEFLNVEVVRCYSWSNPGPSHGIVTVGKARIPLPREVGMEMRGWVRLVRFNCGVFVPEGQIGLSLELREVVRGYYDPRRQNGNFVLSTCKKEREVSEFSTED